MISEEEKHDFIGFASQYLSDYESSVLIEYCKGKTYREIAEILNTNSKSVDNALQRVKKNKQNKSNFYINNQSYIISVRFFEIGRSL